MREIVFLFMDELCRLSGHRLWDCYEDAPEIVYRVWVWSVPR